MTTKPTTEAVDALSRAARLSFDDGVFAPHEFIRSLSEDGFHVQRQTPEAPTPENVDWCLKNGWLPERAEIIRAHIAAQYQQMEKANRDALTEVTRLCKLLAESKAEVERLRFAAANLLDNLHGLTKLQEVQHRAPTWMKAIENSADRLRAIINPEHVSEAKHLEKGGE